jgi:hypothetical protein
MWLENKMHHRQHQQANHTHPDIYTQKFSRQQNPKPPTPAPANQLGESTHLQ